MPSEQKSAMDKAMSNMSQQGRMSRKPNNLSLYVDDIVSGGTVPRAASLFLGGVCNQVSDYLVLNISKA